MVIRKGDYVRNGGGVPSDCGLSKGQSDGDHVRGHDRGARGHDRGGRVRDRGARVHDRGDHDRGPRAHGRGGHDHDHALGHVSPTHSTTAM
jgi:hypothetical protein